MSTTRSKGRTTILPRLALAAVCVACALCYLLAYRSAVGVWSGERSKYDRISWVVGSEHQWRTELEQHRLVLKTNSGLVTTTPQDAANEVQSKLRQALTVAGAHVDSLHGTSASTNKDGLSEVRTTAMVRVSADRVLDVLFAIEGMKPQVALENLDVTVQRSNGAQSLDETAIVNLSVKTYIIVGNNALK